LELRFSPVPARVKTPNRKPQFLSMSKPSTTPRLRAGKAAKSAKPAEELKKADATRQRILDAAALVLSQKGFAGAKLTDIATQAQLKVATLYYYYESREA